MHNVCAWCQWSPDHSIGSPVTVVREDHGLQSQCLELTPDGFVTVVSVFNH